ncbi:hypothetical protein [Blastococcus sp. PRF04-17]|uniref:hypothetical protein n=1 Tax=Blastococcus sp. PRF04-17 TaxID=2933797 RepID=UPI001FF19BEC|nr:hypothetical protein [Blastococcus sp. PRF04-17]UOY03628.1 hypothetical protein MVA48_09985 [Blastococcus sp. PRF04-17]
MARIELDEDGVSSVGNLFQRIEEVARTHSGRPQPEVLAELEKIYADLDYGPTDGLDLAELAQEIANGGS